MPLARLSPIETCYWRVSTQSVYCGLKVQQANSLRQSGVKRNVILGLWHVSSIQRLEKAKEWPSMEELLLPAPYTPIHCEAEAGQASFSSRFVRRYAHLVNQLLAMRLGGIS